LSLSVQNSRLGTETGSFRKAKDLLILAVGIVVLIGSGYLLSCSSGSKSARDIVLAPLSQMPPYVQTAPTSVQEAYRFAVANANLLKQMPCYCGCGKVPHTSNMDCYVKAFKPDGSVAEFERHAFM
jgi:hypothetical protein